MNQTIPAFVTAVGTTCLALAGILIVNQDSFAQKAKPRVPLATPPAAAPQRQAPEVTVKSKHGRWIVRCEKLTLKIPPKAPAKSKSSKGDRGDRKAAKAPTTRIVEQCAMVQSLKAPNGRKVSMQVMFQEVKNRTGKKTMLMRMIVPLGVYLGDGIAMQVDGKAVGRFAYTRCYAQACTATIPVRPDLLAKLKKGKSATYFVYAFPGQGINMPLTLKGFSKGLADL